MEIKKFLFGEKCIICNETRTKRKNKNSEYVCGDCSLELKKQKENKIKCPICGEFMIKEVIEEIIIDKCVKHGVWLDKNEIEELLELSKDSEGNYTVGLATGMALGMSIN